MYPWGWDLADAGVNLAHNAAYIWFLGSPIVAITYLLRFRRQTPNPILKRQSLLFVFAVAAPIVGAVFTGGILPVLLKQNYVLPLDAPISVVSSLLLVYGITRYELLTVSPVQLSATILNLINESVIVTDQALQIVYLNPTAEQLLGVKSETINRRSLATFLASTSAEKLQTTLRTADTNRLFHIDRLDVHAPEHHTVPVRLASSPLRVGSFQAWIMVLSDITTELETRKTIEREVTLRTRELHQARAYLLSSISSLQQGFLLITARGVIELVNDKAAALFNTTEDKLVTQDLESVTGQLAWDHDLTKAVDRVLGGHKARYFSVASADGNFYGVYLTPVIMGTQPLGVTVVVEDQTEQKVLDRSKDEFFSIASHELRTPLTAIRGNMSMAQQYFADALKDPNLASLVNDTHAASVRLIEIVNDFLDSSKLEQGKMTFTFSAVALAPLIQAVQSDLKVLSDQQHNTVIIEPLDQLPPVTADEGRLRQVLYNLMSNANKYTEGGTITVSGVVEGSKVRIRVTDTGKGISAEHQKLLFHKFQQAGDSILTRDNTKGTGLGLYISRLLVQNMHGTVELEHTEEGKGSTFALILPGAPDSALKP